MKGKILNLKPTLSNTALGVSTIFWTINRHSRKVPTFVLWLWHTTKFVFLDVILITSRFSISKTIEERLGSAKLIKITLGETKLCISDFMVFNVPSVFGGSNLRAIALQRNRESSISNESIYSTSYRRGFVLFVRKFRTNKTSWK